MSAYELRAAVAPLPAIQGLDSIPNAK